MIDLTKLAYLAGVIDSDGSISAHRKDRAAERKRPYYAIQLRIHQAQPQAVDLACRLFGGSIHREYYVSLNGRRHLRKAPLYIWIASGPTAASALLRMLPFLRIKRRQAELVIQFQATRRPPGGPVRLSDDVIAERDRLVDGIRSLNLVGKGKGHPQKRMSFDYSNRRPYSELRQP